ncbi:MULTISPECIES: DNA-formamidopyrimidine glycosylase family protein [unclassified Gordonia (in: high G+C Gram-positive bacteria)]|uniref:DNA-formamidopyrimidine glycosylase family protein n=1 Tax=unclassified Gordonia (in: high G+C Gram-positive bacteria) TaxID=2657482 RepID=UPI0009AD3E8B|nr:MULTISPECIES: DNA-formamidopyrimidine glycosylase family protein [unclassified Gordonia (in: high G+C Gram-positive bacteria)]MDF3284763.1 DNA-formamidopyrimidine glycosylase family protein [Gordonia sp. N1V]OPX16099.1 DNA glycosylase [Gordonia sp. i37]
MPEGDTVFRAAARLRGALAGKVLTHTDFRVPRLATRDLSGGVVTGVRSRGKHLLIDVSRDDLDVPVSIHSHLKMEGIWDVHARGAKWRRPGHEARVVLRTETTEAVGFSLGILELLTTPESDLAYLGPDLLGAEWDAAEAVRRIEAHPDTPIGLALLDQHLLAGVGNEYRCELCFLRGVLPERPVAEVDVPAMVDLAHRVLWANRMRTARTTTGATGPHARVYVYGRRGRPCRRCGTLIRRGFLGPPGEDRVIYWCPYCQS